MYLILDSESTYNTINTLLSQIVRIDNTNNKKFSGFESQGYYIMSIDPNFQIPINNTTPFNQLYSLFTQLPNVTQEIADNLKATAESQGYITLVDVPNLRDFDYMTTNPTVENPFITVEDDI